MPNQGTSGGTVGQVIINGAFAFDNVFMINGVDINDNLFAQPQNLFIEDAIEETQVLTSGISAEFGRFSGGVVNAITKSGGNMFSGSGRINFSNPAWTTETPFEISRGTEHIDEVSRVYEGTFGGPLLRDRLWFFTSGRYGKGANQVTLAQTGIGLTSIDTNKRGEIKLTGTVAQNHTIQGGYLNSPRTRTNNSGLQTFIIDPHSEVDRGNPNWYYYTNYRGRAEERAAGRGAVLRAALSVHRRRRHQHRHRRLADSVGAAVPVPLQRAVLRRHRPRAPQQPPADRQRHQFLEPRRPPREQGRLRVVPQPAHRRRTRSRRRRTSSTPTS